MTRTRIAPSPTGNLHIGTARTALFNYLYAKAQGGQYVVRVEDTDVARSTKEFEENIVSGLAWLGLMGDEGVTPSGEVGEFGPYRQSERKGTYRPFIEKLLDEGRAYYCNASKEELDTMREEAQAAGKAFVYRGTPYEGEDTENCVIRYRVTPGEEVSFDDAVRGRVTFHTDDIGDFVIAKGLDYPLYNFVVVVDDELMKISHIIRGEDHISNTPKQVLLNRALGFSRKKFAHLPLILAPDRSKMSKRHGAVSVDEYRKQGFLPEALVNYLALLGWNEGKDREFYTLEELVQAFTLKRVHSAGAVFDIEKLKSMNSHYLKALPFEEQSRYVKQYLEEKGRDVSGLSDEAWKLLVSIEISRAKCGEEVGADTDFVFESLPYESELLVWKKATPQSAKKALEWVYETLYNVDEEKYTSAEIEQILKESIESQEMQRGEVLWPLRVALTGKKFSPSPFEALELLGKTESLQRIKHAQSVL